MEEVAVVVMREGEDYLGRTDRKELSIHTQGNNSIALLEEEVEEVGNQDNLEQWCSQGRSKVYDK